MGLPASEQAVKAAEDELGRSLPPGLRERLLRNNGGEILVKWEDGEDEEWQLHPVWDDSDRETMRRSSNHLVREQDSAKAWPDFPADAISIATLDGDQLVLLPDDDDPKLWLHETGELESVKVVWDP
jgi:cell wall assembly regulator SMI1